MTSLLSLHRAGLFATLLFVCIASVLRAQTITTFDGANSSFTYPTAINSVGQITGYYLGGTQGGLHGFLREADGTFTSFDAPEQWGAPVLTFPTAINSAGQIAGFRSTVGLTEESFLRQPDGTFVVFGAPEVWSWDCGASEAINVVPQSTFFGNGNIATGINTKGQITGVFGANVYRSFLRQPDGTIMCFGVPSSGVIPFTQAQAINRRGQITGFFADSGNATRGFLREPDGTTIRFDVPDSSSTFPTAINGKGQIAGYYDSVGSTQGFLREPDGTFITFGPVAQATAINQAGDITGYYFGADGTNHGFLRKRNGKFKTFDAPGAGTDNRSGTFPQAMDGGTITGYYVDANGGFHGFVCQK